MIGEWLWQKKKSPTRNKNVITKENFVYTPKTPLNISPSTGKTISGGLMGERENWSDNAIFPDGEYKIVGDVVTRLHVTVAKARGSL